MQQVGSARAADWVWKSYWHMQGSQGWLAALVGPGCPGCCTTETLRGRNLVSFDKHIFQQQPGTKQLGWPMSPGYYSCSLQDNFWHVDILHFIDPYLIQQQHKIDLHMGEDAQTTAMDSPSPGTFPCTMGTTSYAHLELVEDHSNQRDRESTLEHLGSFPKD